MVCFHTVKPRLIRTPRYYGQFALSLGKESPYFSLNSIRLIRTPRLYGHFLWSSQSPYEGGLTVLCTSHCTGTVIIQGLYQDVIVQHNTIHYPSSSVAICYLIS